MKLLDWLEDGAAFRRRQPALHVAARARRAAEARAERRRSVCTLQGEDLFLDGLGEPYRRQSLDLIRAASVHVDAFLPVSRYYLEYMPGYLGMPAREDAARSARDQPRRLHAARSTAVEARSPSATSRGLHRRKACTCCAKRIASFARDRASAMSRLRGRGIPGAEHQAYLDGISRRMRELGLWR